MVLLDILGRNRSECPKSDVEQHIRYKNPFLPDGFKQLIREVKSCRRSRRRAVLFGVNRLIAALILELFRYIRRKGHLSRPVQNFLKYAVIVQPDYAIAVLKLFKNGYGKLRVDRERPSRSCPSSGLDKAFPIGFIYPSQQQKFHRAAGFIPRRVKPCRYYLRDVPDKDVAGI